MRESLLFLFTKERPWAICSGFSWQKSVRERIAVVDLKKKRQEWFARDSSKSLSNTRKFAKKNHIFHSFFPPFYAQEQIAPVALRSVAQSSGCHLLMLLFTKEWWWANHSHRSLQKSGSEWFSQVAQDNRVTGAIRSFSPANRSCALSLFCS